MNVKPRTGRPTKTVRRSRCPISCSLDIIGDKWTLLVVRDLLWGKRRYKEFADSPEKIPTNILAERLQRLEGAGIISSKTYQTNPPRYEYHLTPAGNALKAILLEIAVWGKKHIPGTMSRAEILAQNA